MRRRKTEEIGEQKDFATIDDAGTRWVVLEEQCRQALKVRRCAAHV
jgi:hypothetical protein